MAGYSRTYVIAGLSIGMNFPWEETLSEGFETFECDDNKSLWQVYYVEKETLSEPEGEKVYENPGFQVFMDKNGKFCRRFHDYRTDYQPYATMQMDFSKRTVLVEYLLEGIGHFGTSRNDFFHIGWENILIREERMIFHAACVDTSFGGILFSGPSGIGKSTQGNLWCRYRQAKMINGDRPVVGKDEGAWRAYGSPYAGSSKCYVNESCVIKAIVMLKQEEKCRLRRLGKTEAFRKVYEQITNNNWDQTYVTKVCDLVFRMISEIPVYEFYCTPDREAVEFLAEELGK